MTEPARTPATFRLDDPRLVIAPQESASAAMESGATITEAPGELRPTPPMWAMRRVPWGTLFWSAGSGLVLLALGWAVATFVEELLVRAPWLGGIALVLATLAGLALVVVLIRELYGLIRLHTIEAFRHRAEAVIASDDRSQGRALVTDLIALTRRIPQLARARARLNSHIGDIIDGRDLIHMAERELMGPLDAEARRLVAAASKRVSVVTAISPRVAVDMIFVLINALGLIRRLAVLYGGRPGTLGVLKLFRQVVSHLALTGGIAVTDSVLQQVIGHGLAARLSARLGEGMLNGLLTARLGLLAIELIRPLPFQALPQPSLNDLAGSLLRSGQGTPAAAADRPDGSRTSK
jgi:putative membrane protein